jgi:ribosomal protein L11 methylase PrmA
MWTLNAFAVLVVILMVSILWTNLRGAPWLPSSMGKVHKMLAMADVGPNDVVYDLGCGDGRTLITAARSYGARAVGIEIDPLRYVWCQLIITLFGLRRQVKIVFGDFFAQDLSEADVVICYLLPKTNRKLEEKFMRELHPSTRVVSNHFVFPGLCLMRSDNDAQLYLYHPLPL